MTRAEVFEKLRAEQSQIEMCISCSDVECFYCNHAIKAFSTIFMVGRDPISAGATPKVAFVCCTECVEKMQRLRIQRTRQLFAQVTA